MSALGTAIGIIRGRVRGRRLARTIAGQSASITPVAVYFADGPSSLYQLRRWYQTLEALSQTYPTSIITSDPATYDLVRRETTLAVTYAYGAPELTRVLERQGVRLVLYPNHNAQNFRVLRFAVPVHVFIGHGDSAKESSVSRQLKAYDYAFVADETSIEQLRSIRGYDADAAAVVVGSPWLGFVRRPPASWIPDDRGVVLYAPTWEGDRPSMNYSSVENLGDAIVSAVLGDPKLRLIYRPHPWLGRVRSASREADTRIRRAIVAANRGDVVDTGEYGWSLAAADCCIADVSSVVFDAHALGKPVIVAGPGSDTDSASIHAQIEQSLGQPSPTKGAGANSMEAFVTAVGAALRVADTGTL